MSDTAAGARVAVFFAPGLEEVEGLSVVDALFRAKVPCDIVAVEPAHEVTSSHGIRIATDRSVCDEGFSFDDYSVLVLPGGIPGTPNLRTCQPLCDALVEFARTGRTVAAICAAPSVLAELGILRGRRATANPGFQDAVAQGGATVEPDSPVVVDGNVVTSQGAGTALAFGIEIVRLVAGDEAAEHVCEGVVL